MSPQEASESSELGEVEVSREAKVGVAHWQSDARIRTPAIILHYLLIPSIYIFLK
jgi:hypothetical protein